MLRLVTAELDLDLGSSVDMIFQIAAARHLALASEELTFTQGGRTLEVREIVDAHGSRLHRLTAGAGALSVRYRAGVMPTEAPGDSDELERITMLRPSRYCPSDEIFGEARRRFGGMRGIPLVTAVADWVAESVTYTPGVSLGTDSAVTTLRTGQGVCRDYAHLVIATLRAMDVPARYAACYAPGLVPMDFHAVAEAFVDGAWYVIDATRLSDRRRLVRIATGRDAADCAFLSFHGGHVGLDRLHVDAWVDAADAQARLLGADDHRELVRLA